MPPSTQVPQVNSDQQIKGKGNSVGEIHPTKEGVASTYLYTWVERGPVQVTCLALEHNTMTIESPKGLALQAKLR